MAFTIMIKEIIHLRAAARMQQVVLTYIIRNYFHHRAVEIGVDRIANLKPQRFITVNRHACGKELFGFASDFRKEIDNLTAVDVDYCNGLPLYQRQFPGGKTFPQLPVH